MQARARLAASSTGSVDSFSGVVTVSRPDKGLAPGRTRSIDVRARGSSESVAHRSLPVAPLQDASPFGLLFPGCWRSRADNINDASTRNVAGERTIALSNMGFSQVGQSTGFVEKLER
jgi:hypothetical protein